MKKNKRFDLHILIKNGTEIDMTVYEKTSGRALRRALSLYDNDMIHTIVCQRVKEGDG